MNGSFPIKFRVYPENSLYALVYVWPNKRTFRKATNIKDNDMVACCIPVQHKTKNTFSKIFAEVHFVVTEIDDGVVSHEFTHAAIAFAYRIKLNYHKIFTKHFIDEEIEEGEKVLRINSPEERFCYAQSNMVEQFVEKLLRKIR